MVKVSVIIPCYNVEKYIDKCLDSLVNQTFKDYELIIINDGSSDGTEDIIKSYKEKYPKIIKNYYFKNQGISKSRNFGLSKARGEYISFIDSDDYVSFDFLEKMYKRIVDTNSEIVVCDYYKFNDNNEVQEFRLDSFSDSSFKSNPELLLKVNPSPWNKLYKRSLFKNYEFDVIKYEDLLLITKLICSAKKVTKIDECLNYYRVREFSETTVMDERVFDILKILNKLNKFFKDKKYIDKYYSEIEYFNIYEVTMYLIQQKNQVDKNNKKRFIEEGYEFLDKNYPNWRKNKYYKEKKSKLKRVVLNNKIITKIYVR